MDYTFKNLILEGGGVKGIAYVGAFKRLEEKEILRSIRRVGGTSAGAIAAVLLGLNYSTDEIKKVLWNLDFNSFLDDSWGFVRDAKRLVGEYGWYKGDFFRDWIGNIIKAKTGNTESTFSEISGLREEKGFRDIYLVGTNLSTHFSEVFSAEHTPRTCLADAVRISMSIPLFFTAQKSLRGDIYVDGGVLANYPIKLFDRNKYLFAEDSAVRREYYDDHNAALEAAGRNISKYVFNRETLGMRLDSAAEIASYRDHAEPPRQQMDDFFDYAWAFIRTVMEAQTSRHLHSDDWHRTIYIDSKGVGTTQFDLDEETKETLVVSGYEGVEKYFKEFYDEGKATYKGSHDED